MANQSTILTPATSDVCTFSILIDGQAIPSEFNILHISVIRELNRIPAATIHIQDGDTAKATFKASNTDYFIPGKKIEIQLGYRANNDTVFKGIIIKHSLKVRKHTSNLILECRHPAIKMTFDLHSRYYTDKKDSDIMEEVISTYAIAKDVETTKPALKELVQYECSDWDFLLYRAEANGQVVLVEDEKIKVLSPALDTEPVVTVGYGSTLLELDLEMDARLQSEGIRASTWSSNDQDLISAEAKEPKTTNNGNLTGTKLAESIGHKTNELRHGGTLSQAELQAWADSRLLKERLAKVRGRVRFQGFAAVQPGTVIEANGIGERFAGKLYVSGVRHTLAQGNWESDVQLGLEPKPIASLYSFQSTSTSGLVPAISGLQIGIVTALEKDPAGEDRIKVRLPLISTQEEGIWARLATLDAGKERGTYFRPEIADEVVVGFLHNDPSAAVILGMCHSNAKPNPEPAKDTNHLKGYVSREKLRFSFDDEKKAINLETPKGNKVILSDADKGILLQDQNGNKILLNDQGIQIESAKALTLKAAADLKLEGVNTEIKANSAFKASGATTAEVSATNISIKGSTMTVIEGGLVKIN